METAGTRKEHAQRCCAWPASSSLAHAGSGRRFTAACRRGRRRSSPGLLNAAAGFVTDGLTRGGLAQATKGLCRAAAGFKGLAQSSRPLALLHTSYSSPPLSKPGRPSNVSPRAATTVPTPAAATMRQRVRGGLGLPETRTAHWILTLAAASCARRRRVVASIPWASASRSATLRPEPDYPAHRTASTSPNDATVVARRCPSS